MSGASPSVARHVNHLTKVTAPLPSQHTHEGFWAVGLRTSAGIIGPYVIGVDHHFTEIVSSAPSTGQLTILVWESRPRPGQDLLSAAVEYRHDGSAVVVDRPSGATAADQALVIDLRGDARSIRTMEMREADLFVESLLSTGPIDQSEGS